MDQILLFLISSLVLTLMPGPDILFVQGRQTGQYGEKLAVNFLRDFYIENGIKPAENTDNYFQSYQLNLPGGMYTRSYTFLCKSLYINLLCNYLQARRFDFSLTEKG